MKRFSFADRGMRVEDDPDRSDCERRTSKARLSFLSQEHNHLNPHTEYENESLDYQGRPNNNSQQQLDSINLITDDYWEQVMMNTREKKEGPDGIQIWNLCYPIIKNFDQTTAFVKEITEMKLTDMTRIEKLARKWNDYAKR